MTVENKSEICIIYATYNDINALYNPHIIILVYFFCDSWLQVEHHRKSHIYHRNDP